MKSAQVLSRADFFFSAPPIQEQCQTPVAAKAAKRVPGQARQGMSLARFVRTSSCVQRCRLTKKKPATVFIAGFSQEWRRRRDSPESTNLQRRNPELTVLCYTVKFTELRWLDVSRGWPDRHYVPHAAQVAGSDFLCNPLVVLNPRLPLTGQSELANLEAR